VSAKTRIFLIESRAARAPRGGVARYIRHMAEGLHAKYRDRLVVCSRLDDLPSSMRRLYLPLRYPWRYSSQLLYEATNGWERFLLSTVERRLKPDVIFSPLYGPLTSTTPQVFTVYDFRLQIYPDHFEEKGRLLEIEHMKRCFERAYAILSISNATKRDLLHLHPNVDEDKVHVVPLGVSEHFFRPSRSVAATRPYFLFVGNRSGTKNFLRLLEAFAKSGLASHYDLRVISPGLERAGEWSESEQKVTRSENLGKSVKLEVKVSDAQLADAYAGAIGFIFPSEHEGFGLPVLEALASGTVVACSNTSSLPEAGGNAAIYFDPAVVEDISKSLVQIAQMDSTERATRIKEGQRHAASLSWKECVDRTCAILESVASHGTA
jgi:glycosyltransferase involved in cell wall biosynthesis